MWEVETGQITNIIDKTDWWEKCRLWSGQRRVLLPGDYVRKAQQNKERKATEKKLTKQNKKI